MLDDQELSLSIRLQSARRAGLVLQDCDFCIYEDISLAFPFLCLMLDWDSSVYSGYV